MGCDVFGDFRLKTVNLCLRVLGTDTRTPFTGSETHSLTGRTEGSAGRERQVGSEVRIEFRDGSWGGRAGEI